MSKTNSGQKSPFIKNKVTLGFATASHFRGKTFNPNQTLKVKFNPSTFKIQHKG